MMASFAEEAERAEPAPLCKNDWKKFRFGIPARNGYEIATRTTQVVSRRRLWR
jgi:hypothetical protein